MPHFLLLLCEIGESCADFCDVVELEAVKPPGGLLWPIGFFADNPVVVELLFSLGLRLLTACLRREDLGVRATAAPKSPIVMGVVATPLGSRRACVHGVPVCA